MGRVQGKRTPRGVLAGLEAVIDPGAEGRPLTEGERREAGVGETRDIPGGLNHLAPDEVRRQEVPVPDREWPFYRSDLAHGVPPDEAGHHDRVPFDRPKGGQSGHGKLEAPDLPPSPVPVYLVELPGGARAKATAAMRRITLPAAGGEPVTICPASTSRVLVQLLNEDTTHNARFGNLEDLTFDAQNSQFSGGARLPCAATGYTVFRTKEQVFGVSETSSAVVISVIMEDEIRGAL